FSTVSLIAKQTGDTFSPYRTKVGREIEFLSVGYFTAEEMFEQAKSENSILTWILRFVGYLLMIIGFAMIFAPLFTLGESNASAFTNRM
ncbi:protein containing DUF1625, partial [Candidatus Magnetomorum sp. HK-1]